MLLSFVQLKKKDLFFWETESGNLGTIYFQDYFSGLTQIGIFSLPLNIIFQ